jgi:hypothetical protein
VEKMKRITACSKRPCSSNSSSSKTAGCLMIFCLPARALSSGSASCRSLCVQEQVAPSLTDCD